MPDGIAASLAPAPAAPPSGLAGADTAILVENTPIPTLSAALLQTAATGLSGADTEPSVERTTSAAPLAGEATQPAVERTASAAPLAIERPSERRVPLWLSIIGTGLIAGIAAAAVIMITRPRAAPSSAPAPVAAAPVAPAPPPVAAAPTAPPPSAGPPSAPPARAPVALQLETDPPGAEVLDGPRLLGATPLEVHIPASRTEMKVHLEKRGFDPLDYTLSPAEAPRVRLKLTAHRHHDRTKGESESRGHPAGKPVVPVFDDDAH